LADDNKDLNHALTLFGQKKQHDWISLSNVFDAITEGFREKELIAQQFVTQGEIDNFKYSAHPHRHGFTTEYKPRRPKRKESIRQKKEMTLAEAEAWIRAILGAWVKKLNMRQEGNGSKP
jgi:hypothetical protein